MASDDAPPAYRGAWPHSVMETFWPDKRPSVEDACELVITFEGLSLSYHDEDLGPVVYRGVEHGAGHWRVRAAHGATGSLHAFADGERLEGYFSDRGWTGMWAITLSDDPEDG